MRRHELREQVFKLLFRIEFNAPEDMPEQLKLFWNGYGAEEDEAPLSEKNALYISDRVEKIQEKLVEIDELINQNTEGWDTSRMGKVELTILRLAVYEILYDEDVPGSVAINEAVELAKKYGQDNSGGFVNAILAKIVKLGD